MAGGGTAGQLIELTDLGELQAADLTLVGSDDVTIRIGTDAGPAWATVVFGDLEIATDGRPGADIYLRDMKVLGLAVYGTTLLRTGGGDDDVVVTNSAFLDTFDALFGGGADTLAVARSGFLKDAFFHGEDGDDGMLVIDNMFCGRTVFDGGNGSDFINRSILGRNFFGVVGSPELPGWERWF